MSNSSSPIIHLIGSIPLNDAESVFRRLATDLGDFVERIPDGETGRRVRWISFIWDQLKEHRDFEVDPTIPTYKFIQWDGKVIFEVDRLRFKAGIDPNSVIFDTGYAADALRNYETFKNLKSEGVIPAHIKYQICMATPLAIVYNFISPHDFEKFVSAYSRHLEEEINIISETLPHDQVSYQWDVCQEVLAFEHYYDEVADYKELIFSTLAKIAKFVPETIDLGFHLCYGSPKDEHLVQPKDMKVLVELANGISSCVTRPIKYIHMPVPKDRTDNAYFQPLSELSLNNDTALYLGLVHHGDSEGNSLKLTTAQKYVNVDGISSECGLGRGDPEAFDEILENHLQLAKDL